MRELPFSTISYNDEKHQITILDQTRLPAQEKYIVLETPEDVFSAIKNMNVRGAPLIGVAAAYGMVLASIHGDRDEINRAADLLNAARPTAVNLSWAVARMKKKMAGSLAVYEDLLKEARSIEREDKESCRSIGTHGASLIRDHARILVHCNAGALATSGIGTALSMIYTKHWHGARITVFSSETRPRLQGARLTSWELTKSGIETYTICDTMIATVMPDIDLVLVGADRIARNGDTANKIGTYNIAIIARHFHTPFYVAAPLSTFDRSIPDGRKIPIETRAESEVRSCGTMTVVASSAKVLNPAFDVTPAVLITGVVTERGLIEPVNTEAIARVIDLEKNSLPSSPGEQ